MHGETGQQEQHSYHVTDNMMQLISMYRKQKLLDRPHATVYASFWTSPPTARQNLGQQVQVQELKPTYLMHIDQVLISYEDFTETLPYVKEFGEIPKYTLRHARRIVKPFLKALPSATD